MNHLPSHLFRKFFQAYSIWFNKEKNRRGSLFTKYYRRIEITEDEYLKQVVYYIHRNPVKHGLSVDFQIYPYSSFKFYLNYESTWVAKEETLEWYEKDLIYFLEFHRSINKDKDIQDLMVDEV